MHALRSAGLIGVLLVLAGIAFIGEGVIYLAEGSPEQAGSVQNTVALVATLALAAAVAGLPVPEGDGSWGVGRIGVVTAMTGLAVQAITLVVTLAGGGELFRDTIFAIGFLVMALGLISYGVAVLRSDVLPRWWSVAFFLPLLLVVVPGEFGVIVLGVVWLALGGLFLTSRERGAAAARG